MIWHTPWRSRWQWDTVECQGRTFLVAVKEITRDKKMEEVLRKLYVQRISTFPQLHEYDGHRWQKIEFVPPLNGSRKT